MRVGTILLTVTAVFAALTVLKMLPKNNNESSRLLVTGDIPTPIWDSWTHWKQRNNVSFGTDSEDKYRAGVYYENFKKVDASNKTNSHKSELNKFAALTSEEFKSQYLGLKQSTKTSFNIVKESNSGVASSVDWSKTGAVTAVKDQGQCGSCWAFSTTGSSEGLNWLTNKTTKSFSEQQLVDCAGGKYGNQGCNGGLMDQGFAYVYDFGLELESDYGYTATTNSCKYDKSKVAFNYKSHVDVTQKSATDFQTAVSKRTVSIGIDASPLQFYSSGVFSGYCGTQLDHGVLIVGYGTSSEGKDFWKVKNSWASSWGEQGYFRIERDMSSSGPGKCGMLMSGSYPTMN